MLYEVITHFIPVFNDCLCDNIANFCILFHEFGREPVKQAHHIMSHKHLTVTVHTGSNADGGNGNRFGDEFGDGRGNCFQNDGESPGIFQRLCIVNKCLCGLGAFALYLESSKR